MQIHRFARAGVRSTKTVFSRRGGTRRLHALMLSGIGALIGSGCVGTDTDVENDAEEVASASSLLSVGTAAMANPRERATATLLADGRVLVAGGESGGVKYSNAEVYDPKTNTWTTTPAMTGESGSLTQRSYHTAVRLDNGKVMVIGGVHTMGAHGSTSLYDPQTNTWSVGPYMNDWRWGHTTTKLGNGKVLITGGYGGWYHNSGDLYDPATNMFTATTGSMSVPRVTHAAVVLEDGKVLVTGGTDGTTVFDTAEIWDPVTNTFTTIAAKMSSRRRYHSATLLTSGPNKGRVLIAGGIDAANKPVGADLYDPIARTFTPTGMMVQMRAGHGASLLPDGRVFVMGGLGDLSVPLATTEIFDPATLSWSTSDSLVTARNLPGMVSMGADRFFLAGGSSIGGATATAELLRISIDGDLGSALGPIPLASGKNTTCNGRDDFKSSCAGSDAQDRAFYWTAPSTAKYAFSTEGSAIDTVLSVRDPITDAYVGCNDDVPGKLTSLVQTATNLNAGQRVAVVVDTYGTAAYSICGTFQLRIDTVCVSQTETCNGKDDDCDGLVDEGNPGGGASCSTGQYGVCAAGTTACTSGAIVCNRNTAPSGEVCNGLDDDCDGGVDWPTLCAPRCSKSGVPCMADFDCEMVGEVCKFVDKRCFGGPDNGKSCSTSGNCAPCGTPVDYFQ